MGFAECGGSLRELPPIRAAGIAPENHRKSPCFCFVAFRCAVVPPGRPRGKQGLLYALDTSQEKPSKLYFYTDKNPLPTSGGGYKPLRRLRSKVCFAQRKTFFAAHNFGVARKQSQPTGAEADSTKQHQTAPTPK